MAIDYSRKVKLGELKQVVENMKVYIDSDETISVKGHRQINNRHNFYSTPTPDDNSTPLFGFDIAEELFLDQAQTKFVPNFVWSADTYVNSTNPNLDGKPVMVLAVKGEESVTYSFLNLVELVDTYTTKNTASLSLAISEDGEISGDINISEEEGNAVELKDDGLYVATGGEEPLIVSFVYEATGDNTWTVHSVDKTYDEIKTALSENKRVVAKGTNKNARLDNPWYFYPNEYYNSAGNWAVFERIEANGSAIEAFNFTINGDGTATLVETEIDVTQLQKTISGDEGQFVSFDEEGNLIAVDAPTDNSTIKVSSTANNQIVEKADGIYVAPVDLDSYVLKVDGKGLSTNDLTDDLLETIQSIPEDAKYTDTVYTHPTSGVTAGTYRSVTVDKNGHVTEGTNPTTTVDQGGTGANTAKGARYNLLNDMNEVETDVSDTSELVGAYISDASATNGVVYKRKASTLWNYIKSKISSVLGLTATDYDGNAASATKLATQCGILVNLGSFTTGYLDGTVPVEPGIQGTLPIEAGGTGARTAANAREALGAAIKNHATPAATFGQASTTNYGHVRISDNSLATPNSSYGASAAYAASLYSAQKLYARIVDLENAITGYTLVGNVTFGITMEANSVSTAVSINNDGGTLPFTKGGGGTNTSAYFKPSQNITYSCKFKRKHAACIPQLRCYTSVPEATSIAPLGSQFLTSAAMATPTGELADVDYEEVAFSTSNYYYAYHSTYSGLSYSDRGGVLYCYSKGS